MSPEFYTINEVAERLRVTRLTIYRYITEGKLNAYRLGRNYRVSRENLNDFLKERSTSKGQR